MLTTFALTGQYKLLLTMIDTIRDIKQLVTFGLGFANDFLRRMNSLLFSMFNRSINEY